MFVAYFQIRSEVFVSQKSLIQSQIQFRRHFSSAHLDVFLFLVLVLDLAFLVEDLLALAVADQQHDRHEQEDEGAPTHAVTEAERPLAGTACNYTIIRIKLTLLLKLKYQLELGVKAECYCRIEQNPTRHSPSISSSSGMPSPSSSSSTSS